MSKLYGHPRSDCPPELLGFSPSSVASRQQLFSDRTMDEIRRAMTAADVTQRDLATALSLSESRISQMLGKGSNITLRTVDRVFWGIARTRKDHRP